MVESNAPNLDSLTSNEPQWLNIYMVYEIVRQNKNE